MFDLEAFVEECLEAQGGVVGPLAVKALLARAVASPADLRARFGVPAEATLMCLYRSPALTVVRVVWTPGLSLGPHDHQTWAVVGVYGGAEDHALYRQGLDGIVRAGGRLLQQGEVAILDRSAIHAVANSGPTFCEALHVHGGDLFAQPRTAWDEVTWRAGPYDPEQTRRRFEDANRHMKFETNGNLNCDRRIS